MKKLILAAVVALAAIAGAYALWSPPVTNEPAGFGSVPRGVDRARLNLVVITLDTTRADRLGAYGRADAGTPVFDRLAEDGVLFEQATSSAPITLPAHSSIFTGRFPPQHGVRDNGGFFLDPGATTLAERFAAWSAHTPGFILLLPGALQLKMTLPSTIKTCPNLRNLV